MSFQYSLDVIDLGGKDWGQGSQLSVAATPINFMYFPPYPEMPYSKWTSLSLGHLHLWSLGIERIHTRFPYLPAVLIVKMKIDNG